MKMWSGFRCRAVAVNIRILAGVAIILLVCCRRSALQADENLPKIRPAPEFTLTNQDGKRLALKDLRGKVLAITFIFASCADTCPLLTAKMAGIQNRLGADIRPAGQFRLDHRGPGARHAGGAQTLRRSAQGQSRGLGVPDRHTGRDPRRRQALRHLLQEDAARRRGPYVSHFACGSERHTARAVHGRQIRSGRDVAGSSVL